MQQTQFILYVKDQNASRDFYKNIFNLEPLLDVPGMTEFQLLNGCKLGLMPENGIAKILQDKTPHPATGNGIPRCELYLLVENPEEYFQRALKNGAKEISPMQPRDWGHKAGYVGDPDGHVLAFAK